MRIGSRLDPKSSKRPKNRGSNSVSSRTPAPYQAEGSPKGLGRREPKQPVYHQPKAGKGGHRKPLAAKRKPNIHRGQQEREPEGQETSNQEEEIINYLDLTAPSPRFVKHGTVLSAVPVTLAWQEGNQVSSWAWRTQIQADWCLKALRGAMDTVGHDVRMPCSAYAPSISLTPKF